MVENREDVRRLKTHSETYSLRYVSRTFPSHLKDFSKFVWYNFVVGSGRYLLSCSPRSLDRVFKLSLSNSLNSKLAVEDKSDWDAGMQYRTFDKLHQ